MVRLSAITYYAIRAMIDLAMNSSARTTIPAIAERQGISRKFLPAVLQSLIQAGLVHSVRGWGGGVELSADPKKITIQQIIESVEGPQLLYADYMQQSDSQLNKVLKRAGDAMFNILGSTTLADLIPKTTKDSAKKK